ncbi:MAG TPA: Rieske (2Fe-2S) protein, partial [Chloroflexota bacterium]|nr:Rieske (2Fe-2S) protein [Chloroflexota bacterium]
MATTTARPQRAGRDGDAGNTGNGTERGEGLVLAGSMEDLRKEGVLTVSGASGGVRHAVAVFLHEGRAYALDNRCPHMGFPLSRGSCSEGIVICYWH